MSAIFTARYSELLGRLLGASGVLEVAPDLSPEISATLVLENDRPEWAFLSNQRLIAAAPGVAALAGNFSGIRVRNPPTSSVLAIIEAMECFSSTAAVLLNVNVGIGAGTTDRATTNQAAFARDSRTSTAATQTSALVVSVDNTLQIGNGIEQLQANAANQMLQAVNLPIVLAPGSFYDFATNAFALSLFANLRWRERNIGKYEQR